MKWFRELLGEQRFALADVGAAHGLPPHLAMLEDVADLIFFEPNPEEARSLEARYRADSLSRMVRVYPCALSKTGGLSTLYVTNQPTGSSLLRPREDHPDEIGDLNYFYPLKEVTIQTRTLRSIVEESGGQIVDFAKLDVQGAELDILVGLGNEYVGKMTGVELEIGMPGAYVNQPSYSEIDSFLRSNGLELFDIKPARCHRGLNGNYDYYPVDVFGVHPSSPTIAKRVWEIDAVYFRKPQKLLEDKDILGIRRLASMYCVYGFFQEAVHLTEQSVSSGVMGLDQSRVLREKILGWHRHVEYCPLYSPMLYSMLLRAKKLMRRVFCGRRRDWWQNS